MVDNIHVYDIGLTHRGEFCVAKEVLNASSGDGSFFEYGINDLNLRPRLKSKRLCSSHAAGGFSRVYSGSILRPQNEDLIDWPEDSIPEDNDFKAIISSLDICQFKDDLATLAPLDGTSPRISPELSCYLGRSRIALSQDKEIDGCVNSSKSTFCSSAAFDAWSSLGVIRYFSGVYVESVKQGRNKVDVYCRRGSKSFIEAFDKIYLAAGCVNTTSIIGHSMGESKELYIKSAPIHLGAYIRWKFRRDKSEARCNSIVEGTIPDRCQYFHEFKSANTGYRWSHTQLGPMNTDVREKVSGLVPLCLTRYMNMLLKNVWFSISTLNSTTGEDIPIVVDSVGPTIMDRLTKINERPLRRRLRYSLELKLRILSKFKTLKLLPIPFGSIIGDVLRKNRLGGWHIGGSLPMSARSESPYTCKPTGELRGIKGVYVVDSAGFPSVPGSSIALLSMANAYHIARNSL